MKGSSSSHRETIEESLVPRTKQSCQEQFNQDLCQALIEADIPPHKLKNEGFRKFLAQYCAFRIPDESTLKKSKIKVHATNLSGGQVLAIHEESQFTEFSSSVFMNEELLEMDSENIEEVNDSTSGVSETRTDFLNHRSKIQVPDTNCSEGQVLITHNKSQSLEFASSVFIKQEPLEIDSGYMEQKEDSTSGVLELRTDFRNYHSKTKVPTTTSSGGQVSATHKKSQSLEFASSVFIKEEPLETNSGHMIKNEYSTSGCSEPRTDFRNHHSKTKDSTTNFSGSQVLTAQETSQSSDLSSSLFIKEEPLEADSWHMQENKTKVPTTNSSGNKVLATYEVSQSAEFSSSVFIKEEALEKDSQYVELKKDSMSGFSAPRSYHSNTKEYITNSSKGQILPTNQGSEDLEFSSSVFIKEEPLEINSGHMEKKEDNRSGFSERKTDFRNHYSKTKVPITNSFGEQTLSTHEVSRSSEFASSVFIKEEPLEINSEYMEEKEDSTCRFSELRPDFRNYYSKTKVPTTNSFGDQDLSTHEVCQSSEFASSVFIKEEPLETNNEFIEEKEGNTFGFSEFRPDFPNHYSEAKVPAANFFKDQPLSTHEVSQSSEFASSVFMKEKPLEINNEHMEEEEESTFGFSELRPYFQNNYSKAKVLTTNFFRDQALSTHEVSQFSEFPSSVFIKEEPLEKTSEYVEKKEDSTFGFSELRPDFRNNYSKPKVPTTNSFGDQALSTHEVPQSSEFAFSVCTKEKPLETNSKHIEEKEDSTFGFSELRPYFRNNYSKIKVPVMNFSECRDLATNEKPQFSQLSSSEDKNEEILKKGKPLEADNEHLKQVEDSASGFSETRTDFRNHHCKAKIPTEISPEGQVSATKEEPRSEFAPSVVKNKEVFTKEEPLKADSEHMEETEDSTSGFSEPRTDFRKHHSYTDVVQLLHQLMARQKTPREDDYGNKEFLLSFLPMMNELSKEENLRVRARILEAFRE